GYALIHLRRPGVALVLLWGLGYVVAGALTLDPPAYQRLLGMALSAALLSGLALDRALSHLPSGRVWGALALVLGLGLALLSGARNWTDSLNWASDPRTAGVRMQVVHFLESQPAEYRVVTVSDSLWWRDREFRFLLPDRAGISLERGDVEAGSVA